MNKTLLIGIVIGLLAGWLIEWAIDWIYWRKKCKQAQTGKSKGKDNLKKIKGIGPDIEARLNQAGIYTFADLSALKQADVEKIIGKVRNVADEEKLIKEAKRRADKKARKKVKKDK
ncbi:MAG TPA: hypothetical protein G4N92_08010 [Anaerolineae bacterium]|nr:hypothetical protein [Anaerolineae bacterium]